MRQVSEVTEQGPRLADVDGIEALVKLVDDALEHVEAPVPPGLAPPEPAQAHHRAELKRPRPLLSGQPARFLKRGLSSGEGFVGVGLVGGTESQQLPL